MLLLKTPHAIVTLYRTTRIIQRLHKERNFNVKADGEAMQQLIDFVMLRTLSNDEIIEQFMDMHTIELIELDYPLN